MKKPSLKKTKPAKTGIKPKHPVPEWMDEEMQAEVGTMDIPQRITLAEKLENRAAQLRDLKSKPVEFADTVTINLLPSAKLALLEFGHRFGNHENDKVKLACGTRWFLEGALPLIAQVAEETNRVIWYRDAEDVEARDFDERRIRAGLEKWRAQLKERAAKADDQDSE